MKKLVLHTLFIWILLPIASHAMFKTFTNNLSHTNKFLHQRSFNSSTAQYGMLDRWLKKSNGPPAESLNQTKPLKLQKVIHPLNNQFVESSNQVEPLKLKKMFEQLDNQFTKIRFDNCLHKAWSEYKISPHDTESIVNTIANIEPENINKKRQWNDTFLNTCINETPQFPAAVTEKIIKKLLEKGADIGNPKALYIPLWLAVFRGNAGAYNALIDHSPKTHLVQLYESEVLKLPSVIAFGLEQLKTIEEHYTSELQKIKNGERRGYTYTGLYDRYRCEPYSEVAVAVNLEDTTWLKNQFQKIQDRTTYYLSKNKAGLALQNYTFEEKPLMKSFLEKHIYSFDKYKHGKIHEENLFANKYWD